MGWGDKSAVMRRRTRPADKTAERSPTGRFNRLIRKGWEGERRGEGRGGGWEEKRIARLGWGRRDAAEETKRGEPKESRAPPPARPGIPEHITTTRGEESSSQPPLPSVSPRRNGSRPLCPSASHHIPPATFPPTTGSLFLLSPSSTDAQDPEPPAIPPPRPLGKHPRRNVVLAT